MDWWKAGERRGKGGDGGTGGEGVRGREGRKWGRDGTQERRKAWMHVTFFVLKSNFPFFLVYFANVNKFSKPHYFGAGHYGHFLTFLPCNIHILYFS